MIRKLSVMLAVGAIAFVGLATASPADAGGRHDASVSARSYGCKHKGRKNRKKCKKKVHKVQPQAPVANGCDPHYGPFVLTPEELANIQALESLGVMFDWSHYGDPVCLQDGIGDWDCAGGTGDGPNYVTGPVQVMGGDPFGLDADGDGRGCE